MTNKNLACVRGVLGAKGDAFSDAELKKVIEALRSKKQKSAKDAAGTQSASAVSAIAQREAEELRMRAAIQKRNAAENAIKRRNMLDQQFNYRSLSEWAEAMAAPSNRNVLGSRDSAQYKQDGYIGKYVSGLMAAFDQAGLTKYVTTRLRDLANPNKWGKGPLDDNVARELWELTVDGGKPGKTGSKEAQEVAKIIHKFQELARADLNRLGAFIGKMPGYIVAQTHDMARIGAVPFEQWRKVAEKAFGNDRTYKNLNLTGDAAHDKPILDRFWGNVHYALSTGEHFKATEADGFKGSRNEAKALSHHRVLHPNSADDWIGYNDQFGASSLMEAVVSGLTRAGKSAGLMEKFGTNPRANFDGMIADARKAANERGQPIESRIRAGQRGYTSRLFDVLDGTADIPGNLTAAKLGSVARAWQSIAKLGAAAVASLTDPILSAARIRDTYGDNLFSAIAENIGMRMKQWVDKGQQREWALLQGVAFDVMARDLASRMTGADSVNFKWVHKVQNAYFKLNLLSKITESGELGLAAMHGARLGLRKNKAFAELEPQLQDELRAHNIQEKEWDIIRKHTAYEHDGTTLLVADKLRDMPLEEIDAIADLPKDATERQLTRRRELAIMELESRFRAFGLAQVHGGVIRGATREKTYTTRGMAPGTVEGEVARFMMQFKQYPIAFVQQVLGRYAQEDRFWSIPGGLVRRMIADRGVLGNVSSLIVSLTAVGYIIGALKDLAKGREPRDPTDPRTWGAAMIQGGGAGIYGDFLFARTNRFGGTLLETAVGPFFGSIADVGEITLGGRDAAISDLIGDGETEYPDNELFNWFKGNTPFLNLFYTRAALDYAILYDVQEALSPGSLRRLETRLRKEQGQEFLLPPSEDRLRPVTQ